MELKKKINKVAERKGYLQAIQKGIKKQDDMLMAVKKSLNIANEI